MEVLKSEDLNNEVAKVNEVIRTVNQNTTSIESLTTEVSKIDELSETVNQNSSSIEAIMDKLFPLTLSVSGGGYFEKGNTQTITVKWTLKEGDKLATPDEVKVNGEVVEGDSKVFSGVSTNTTYKVDAKKGPKTVSGSTTASFVNPSYFGAVSEDFVPSEGGIKALTKIVKGSKAYTGTINLVNQKTCYSYPKSFGNLTKILDSNNVDYIGSYALSELTVNGETYNVYLLKDPTTITGFKQIFS